MSEPPNQGPDFSKPSSEPDPYGQNPYGSAQPGQPGQTPPQPGQTPGGAPDHGQQPPAYGQPGAGYGQPSGDPAAGYGQPAGAPQQVNVGEALTWAWAQFKANPGPMIVPGVIMFALGALATGLYFTVAALATTTTTTTYPNGLGGTYSFETTTSSFGVGGILAMIVIYLVLFVGIIYLSAAMITGALRVADGESVSVATFLKPERLGPVIGTGILVGLITAVGLVLCVIPGLIAIFLLQFAIFFVIDKRLSPTAAMSASSQLARSSVSNSLLTLIVAYVLSYVGALLCYVGLVVTWPLGQLFYAHCYRRMSGGFVAPAPQ